MCTARFVLSSLNISSVGTNFETFREQVGYLHLFGRGLISMPPGPKAEVDKTLLDHDLHNSSYPTKAEINNCFIIHSKYFLPSNL